MKKIVLLLLCTSLFYSCKEKIKIDGFVVKGKFDKIDGPVVVMFSYYDDKNYYVKEEQISKNGEFSFTGKTTAASANLFFAPYVEKYTKEQPQYWEITMKEIKSKPFLMKGRTFFLQDGTFEFSGDNNLETAKLTTSDSESQELFNVYNKEFQNQSKKYGQLLGQKEVSDSIGLAGDNKEKLTAQVENGRKAFIDYPYAFARKHPDSKVSLVALKGDGVNVDIEQLSSALQGLPKDLQNTPVVTALRKLVDVSQRSNVGKDAVVFSLEDTNGVRKGLAAYSGKYVLVDFWASWCGPCRAENPNVLKAYNKFKSKNFDVISISIDQKKDQWLKAVAEDKLPWLNVIDDKEADKSMGRAYAVLSVPSNFLIDPSGKIIAKDLKGEELHSKLAEFLK